MCLYVLGNSSTHRATQHMASKGDFVVPGFMRLSFAIIRASVEVIRLGQEFSTLIQGLFFFSPNC